MKKFAILLFAGLLAAAPAAWAHEHEGSEGRAGCALKGGDCEHDSDCDDCAKGSASHCPIAAKFFMKAHVYLENKDELGLTDEQVETIKKLKSEMKKLYIRQDADMEIGMMDMEEKLSAPQVDVEGLNKMIDDGMAGMTATAKSAVASYAKLKTVLTPEQAAKAKTLWKAKK